MTFQEFMPRILDAVREIAGEDKVIDVRNMTKNTGIKMMAMTIRDSGEAEMDITPILYLEPYYEKAEEGVPIRHLARMLCDAAEIRPSLPDKRVLEDAGAFLENVYCKLVNGTRNEAMLEACPHEPWQDLAVVYYCEMGEGTEHTATATVTYGLLNSLGLSEDSVREQAWKNTKEKKPVVFRPLMNVLDEMGGEMGIDDAPEESQLYLLSTEGAHLGAIAGAMPDACRMAAERFGRNFFMIPSSIHEFLLLPDAGDADVRQLNEMIRTINESEVAPCEVLGDEAYYCEAKNLTIMPAEEYKERLQKNRQAPFFPENTAPVQVL